MALGERPTAQSPTWWRVRGIVRAGGLLYSKPTQTSRLRTTLACRGTTMVPTQIVLSHRIAFDGTQPVMTSALSMAGQSLTRERGYCAYA